LTFYQNSDSIKLVIVI